MILVIQMPLVLTLTAAISASVTLDSLEMERIVQVCLSLFVFVFEVSSFLDINECEMVISPCDGNATCIDTEGSFLCVCNSGYSGNGSFCASILYIHRLKGFVHSFYL